VLVRILGAKQKNHSTQAKNITSLKDLVEGVFGSRKSHIYRFSIVFSSFFIRFSFIKISLEIVHSLVIKLTHNYRFLLNFQVLKNTGVKQYIFSFHKQFPLIIIIPHCTPRRTKFITRQPHMRFKHTTAPTFTPAPFPAPANTCWVQRSEIAH